MIFKVKRGTHYGADGKAYKKGALVESSRDLVAVFSKAKFERDYAAEQKTDGTTANSKPNIPRSASKLKAKKSKKEVSSEHGIDVTSEFPTATKVGVKVFEKSKWYTAVDEQDDEVLNEKKLRRKDVESFLEQYLNVDDNEDEDDED